MMQNAIEDHWCKKRVERETYHSRWGQKRERRWDYPWLWWMDYSSKWQRYYYLILVPVFLGLLQPQKDILLVLVILFIERTRVMRRVASNCSRSSSKEVFLVKNSGKARTTTIMIIPYGEREEKTIAPATAPLSCPCTWHCLIAILFFLYLS